MPKSKAEIQAEVGFSEPPSDRFMELLGWLGDEDVISGPALDATDRSYTPGDIEAVVRTNSYFVSTVGGAPLHIVKQYIANQKRSDLQ